MDSNQLEVDELTNQYVIIQSARKPKRWPGDEGEQYWFFTLHAPNHEPIAQSEQYTGESAHRNILELLDKYFYNFEVTDESE